MSDDPAEDDWYGAETSTFGDRLAGAREHMGMSRQDLARRLGVKVVTVTAWEEDLSEPRANKLQMLSGLLNVSMTWLLTAEGDGLPPPDTEQSDEDLTVLLTEMRQIRGEMLRFANRISVLEKRLRRATHDRV